MRSLPFVALTIVVLGLASCNEASIDSGNSVPTRVFTHEPPFVYDTCAILMASIVPLGVSGVAFFEYGSTRSYGSRTIDHPVVGTVDSVVIRDTVGNLVAGTAYHFRSVFQSGSAKVIGNDKSFTTQTALPDVITDSATGIQENQVTFEGRVNPGSYSGYYFTYGKTSFYELGSTPLRPLSSGPYHVKVNEVVQGLHSGTQYHYRCVGTSYPQTSVVSNGSSRTVTTTSVVPPSVITYVQTDLTEEGVTLHGKVNPNGGSIIYYFFIRVRTYTGEASGFTNTGQLGTGTSDITFTEHLTGLAPGGTYDVKAQALKNDVTVIGNNVSFTVPFTPFEFDCALALGTEWQYDYSYSYIYSGGELKESRNGTHRWLVIDRFESADITTFVIRQSTNDVVFQRLARDTTWIAEDTSHFFIQVTPNTIAFHWPQATILKPVAGGVQSIPRFTPKGIDTLFLNPLLNQGMTYVSGSGLTSYFYRIGNNVPYIESLKLRSVSKP